MGVLSILDREDLKVIYELVMEEYKDRLPEGFDMMLWGDLMIMFNQVIRLTLGYTARPKLITGKQPKKKLKVFKDQDILKELEVSMHADQFRRG
ncbi:hypothetical protein Tco_1317036 [Tanacetum coccineum]